MRRHTAFRELVAVFEERQRAYQLGTLEWPAAGERPFTLHHEGACSSTRPTRLWFGCTDVAGPGAHLAIADGRDIFRRLPTEIQRRWAERGVMYVRYLGDGLDLPWPRVFGTSDWSQVEARCRRLGIDWEWKNGGVLLLSKVCTPMVSHPSTLDRVWFSDVHLCHPGAIETRRGVSMLKPPTVPGASLQVYHADGSAIRRSDLALIKAAFEASRVVIEWEPGDVLMLDNLLTAHGLVPRDDSSQLAFAQEYPCEASGAELDPLCS